MFNPFSNLHRWQVLTQAHSAATEAGRGGPQFDRKAKCGDNTSVLVDPLELPCGAVLPNRVFFGPHETNLGVGRGLGDRHVGYYSRRSVGGSGTIVTETASVHPLDWPYERSPLAADCGPGWLAITSACPGSVVIASIGHAGLQGTSAYSQREVWAPSRVPDAVTRELPKELESSDVSEVLEGFASAATVAAEAGCHGVEINAGQYSLVRQFISGLTNMRSDEWGPGDNGTGRLRFVSEVIERVRRAVGTDQILGLRLSCDELAPWAGLTPDAASEVAAAVASSVDYLVVVRGSIYSADATRPDSHQDPGFNLDLAGQIRAAVEGKTAVVAQGSIVDPDQAEWAVSEGVADAVEMTRAQIADPDLVQKVKAGRTPRPCVLCNQKCSVRDARNPIVSCVVNPTAGFETNEPESPPTASLARHFAIVGAGPSGLEAGRLLAEAGHQVVIYDEANVTGSVIRDWAVASGREPFAAIVDWLEAECVTAGVVFELGRCINKADLKTLTADGVEVVVATGSVQGQPNYQVDDDAPLQDASDLLRELRLDQLEIPSGPVVIVDPIGGPIAISIAESMAHHGASVTLVTPDVIAGTQLSLSGDLAAASSRMAQAGIKIEKRQIVRLVSAEGVEIENRFTAERRILPAELVIDAGPRLPNSALSSQANIIGDAVAPRTVYEAILEGRRAAIALCVSAPIAVAP